MANTATQTTAEYEAEFEMLMQEAARLNELMAADRIQIERLKRETTAFAEETSALLADIVADQQVRKEQRDQEIAARDQENIALRVKYDRLRHERGLPPWNGVPNF